jgi:hypothetical protein
MAYTTEEGRNQILDDSVAAVNDLAQALGALGDVYDLLPEQEADELEIHIFAPLQKAYGLLKRAHTEFAQRSGLTPRYFNDVEQGPVEEARDTVERVADLIQGADDAIAELQDTLLPVEVGDRELRDALSGTRELLAHLPGNCDEFVSRHGR